MADLTQPTDTSRHSHVTFTSEPRHMHLVQQQQEKNTSPWNTSELMVMSVSKYQRTKNIADCTTRNEMRLLYPPFHHSTGKLKSMWCAFLYAKPWTPGSVVGIATAHGLEGPGIECRWGARFSAPVQNGPEAHPTSCKMGTGSFPGVRCGRGVTLTPHPLLVPRSKIE
jgi:hypothetical protein